MVLPFSVVQAVTKSGGMQSGTEVSAMAMRWIFGVPVVLVLAACQPEVAPEPIVGTCGATELQDLVGQPQTVLQTMRFGQTMRVIRPGMAVTMDYSEGRLNIWIGEDGLIERVTCG
jgi:Peptidase inhibitor I78 family